MRRTLARKTSRVTSGGRLRALLSVLKRTALLFAICTVPAAAQPVPGKLPQMTTVHYAATGISFAEAPYLVAVAKKFFEAENLDVQYVVAPAIGSGLPAASRQGRRDRRVLDERRHPDRRNERRAAVLVFERDSDSPELRHDNQAQHQDVGRPQGEDHHLGGPRTIPSSTRRVMARANGLQDSDYSSNLPGRAPPVSPRKNSGAVDAAS